jgi:mRNA (guanine-N7-)-methyltransferase
MPAFDPVRDAVLNSPVTPTQPLTSPYARREHHSSSPAADARHITSSPTLQRRATDLSVLLNDDSQEPTIRASPTSRPSTLSHILHPNHVPDDKLAQTVPFRRPSLDSFQQVPLPDHPTLRMSTPPPSTLPYKPTRRITPATNVLVPMTQGEVNLYGGDRCRFGARILMKKKRARSAEPEEEPPSKKRLTNDADVVATHCKPGFVLF